MSGDKPLRRCYFGTREVPCGAWIYILRNVNTGKTAPIDVAPVPDGNISIDLERRTYTVVAKRDREQLIELGGELHMNHWATCPAALAHAEQQKRKRELYQQIKR